MTTEEHKPFVTTYYSIGGYKAVLMGWDDEINCYVPYQTGFFGYSDVTKAQQDAKDWAEAEEIELRL